eukprot:gene5461-6144_t
MSSLIFLFREANRNKDDFCFGWRFEANDHGMVSNCGLAQRIAYWVGNREVDGSRPRGDPGEIWKLNSAVGSWHIGAEGGSRHKADGSWDIEAEGGLRHRAEMAAGTSEQKVVRGTEQMSGGTSKQMAPGTSKQMAVGTLDQKQKLAQGIKQMAVETTKQIVAGTSKQKVAHMATGISIETLGTSSLQLPLAGCNSQNTVLQHG